MALLLSCALPVAAQKPPDATALGPLQGRWYSRSTESDGKQQSGVNKADLHVITGREVVGLVEGSIVSQATSWRTSELARVIFCMARASDTVTLIGKPSGTATTMMMTIVTK